MFDALSERFDGIFSRLRSRGKLSEADIDAVAREIRLALLEADVNVKVVKALIARLKERANGAEVQKSLSPAQQVIKIVHEELITTLGGTSGKLTMSPKPPTVVMMCGLQGAGKTTAAAKLARQLKSQGLQVLLVAADLARPAAVEQLRVLGSRVDVPVWSVPEDGPQDAVEVARTALDEAARLGRNVVIVDTAGRLQIDTELMLELKQVRDVVNPTNTLLVVDAMTGQEAVNVATAFDEAVGLDGVVLTKIDGDARGGAALSVKEVVGKPILFVGTGEKLEDFEPFHPDRMASRILGMGDVLTLIEKAEANFDADVAQRAQESLSKGQFTLEDFLEQMRQVRKMGPIGNIMKMLPGMPKEMKNAEVDEGEINRIEAIICSMTAAERRDPTLINGSRRVRIAKGSGTSTSEVNALLKQFKQVQQMMKALTGGGKRPKLRGLAGMDLSQLQGGN
ncbi:MAG: signal recognition particle protein [Acidimicrobiia bacterium]|nr:signal recognition particle protein [Acidimicrobiia bacterium]